MTPTMREDDAFSDVGSGTSYDCGAQQQASCGMHGQEDCCGRRQRHVREHVEGFVPLGVAATHQTHPERVHEVRPGLLLEDLEDAGRQDVEPEHAQDVAVGVGWHELRARAELWGTALRPAAVTSG